MLTVHPLLGDNAVVQCEKPLVFRGGGAAPRACVTVRFAGLTGATTAGADGAWSVEFPAQPPGGPHELVVGSAAETLRRTGLLLGEVWLCSGQSNMEWTLGMLKGLEADIAAAGDPQLRCFTLTRVPQDAPSTDLSGIWREATPRHARDFSATAYFFACRLRAATKRPVGIIVSAFGGTSIASWLPREVLTSRPDYRRYWPKAPDGKPPEADSFTPHPYEGRTPRADGWEAATFDDSAWNRLPVPGYWQESAWRHNGAVWYRRAIVLPMDWRGRDLVVEFGACDDFDETFVNGTRVGGIGPEAPNAYATRRVYPVPAAIMPGDTATIAVRVFDHWGNGGITGGAWLRRADGRAEPIPLSGSWRAKAEKALPLRATTDGLPPMVLYNGMIHPLVGCALRGFLWYQGESDTPHAALYRMLLPDLIAAWRSLWRDPLLPFGIVQIANHQPRSNEPVESDWAELRDAQLLTARTVPATGLAVTIDVGDAGDIHPNRKRPVGERLARWALATVHGRAEEPWSSPLPADHWIDGATLCVRFLHAGDGLRTRDGAPLGGFQIAGADRQWRWAEAEITQRDIVRLRAAEVSAPVAARYAWQANPPCTLENSAGLPASPFRTDDWPLITMR